MGEGNNVEIANINGTQLFTNGNILSREPLGTLGGTEQKWRDVINLGQRPIEFIERHPSDVSVPERGKKNPLEFTVERIKILHESGIPTPVFYKASISGGDPVLLAENVVPIGGAIYGKSAVERVSRGEILEIDRVFVDLIDKSRREVFGKDENDPPAGSLWSWFVHANTKGVLLPQDDAMELVIGPDRSFRWVVVDPAGVSTKDELQIDPMDVVNKNLEAVKSTFEDVYQTLYKAVKEKLQG